MKRLGLNDFEILIYSSIFVALIIFLGVIKIMYWNSNEILFNDLKQITINNNNRSHEDTISVVSSFIFENERNIDGIAGNKLNFEDIFENPNTYIGNFIEFKGVFLEKKETKTYEIFDINKCRFITDYGIEVIVYNVTNNHNEFFKSKEILPKIKKYLLVRGTVINIYEYNNVRTIEVVGRIQN